MSSQRKIIRQLLATLAGLLLVSMIIYWSNGDRVLARMIFEPDGVWPGIDRFPWNLLYNWAALPAMLIAGAAGLILVGGFVFQALKKQRRAAVFLLLLLALAPGLLVNSLLKDHLGRARPREIVSCGGSYAYTEFWQPGTTGKNSSFPSGHAAIAFYPLGLWFVLRRRYPTAARAALLFGLGFGGAVSLARMLQGGHFLSDVIWAGGLDFLVAGVLALFIKPDAR